MGGFEVPQVCMEAARTRGGKPVVLRSGERLICSRRWGHFPRWPHAGRDDSGQLGEWR